jgi:tellurite resistance protein
MKKKIGIDDLRLNVEQTYFKKIDPIIQSLRKRYDFLNKQQHKRDVEFYTLISQSIDINEHYAIKYLLDRVKKNLLTDVRISMYLHQSTVFSITCIPRIKKGTTEALIFVSQHFFNNLNEDEQLAIIGHEVAHFILGHLNYSVHEILSYPFDLEEINGLKSDLLAWSKACEITADMFGLVANDFNFKAYSTAIIKHFTGLNDSSNSNFNIVPLVELALKQYDYLASDPLYHGDISTHPLTPLRVKIINSATKSSLIKNFGETFGAAEINKAKREYNKLINDLIKDIYPEMFPGSFEGSDVLPAMSYAVALSDGILDDKEYKAIRRMLPKAKTAEDYLKVIREKEKKQSYKIIVDELVEKAIKTSRENSFSKHTLVPIIRVLLVIAASDDEITIEELNTIFNFAKAFDFTRHEIITILKTHNNIHY